MSNSLRPHESHHARPPCPSPTPGGQSTGVSALASFLPKKSRGQSPSEWTGWISLQSKGLKSLLQHHSSKASILRRSAFFTVQLLHPYMTTVKTIALTRWTLVGKAHSCSTLCDLMDCSTPDFPVLHYLPEFAPTHAPWINDAIQPSHPLLPASPPAFSLSRIRSFPKGRIFPLGGQSIGISVSSLTLSNQYSGLISFRIGWFDLIAVQGSFKSLLQHHSSKSSILQHSAFFVFQLFSFKIN